MVDNRVMLSRISIFIMAMVFGTVCGRAQDRAIHSNREKEAALGAQLAAQVRRSSTPLELPAASLYLEALGQELASQMPNPTDGWKFNITKNHPNGSTLEPISLPGGWVFIPAQLIIAVSSEAELAGMLAHAMAHVSERPWLRQTPGGPSQSATIPLIFIGGSAGIGGDDPNMLLPVGYLKTHRENELEADRVAVRAMSAAGFDPSSLLHYIARVQLGDDKRPLETSPLPSLAARVTNFKQTIRTLPEKTWRPSDKVFPALQNEVRQALMRGSRQARSIPSLIHPNQRQ